MSAVPSPSFPTLTPPAPPSLGTPPRPLFTPAHIKRVGVPLFRVDAGWLFLIAGLITLGATVLIPAQHDLDTALWQRERAAVIEKHRLERIDHYAQYLKGLETGDESVVMSLAAVQLNKSPVDRVPLSSSVRQDPTGVSASIFPHLEPAPAILPGKPVVTERSSILARWTINDHTRLWLLAGGVLCILLGLLPAAPPRPARPAQSVN